MNNKIEAIFNYLIPKLKNNFHLTNSIGWSLMFLLDTFLVTPQLNLVNYKTFIGNVLIWSYGYLLSIGLRQIYKNVFTKNKSILHILSILSLSIIISATLWETVYIFTEKMFFGMNTSLSDHWFSRSQLMMIARIIPFLSTWSFLYLGIKYWLSYEEARDRAEKANLLAQSARLELLRYQINPHFLFNSFSSLRALIRIDQKKAEEMLSKLSEFYRYSLVTQTQSEVALIKEIKEITHYLEIEKIRFDDKIEFFVYLEDSAEEYPVPVFILHPILENAIKFGMKTSPKPLKIEINASVNNKNALILEISNTGKFLIDDSVPGTGTGLTNIKNRLDLMYPENNCFELFEKDGKVIVRIEINRKIR